jgi:transcriptional regulator with GAF, ATPase, and Fis domain
MVAKNQFRSDLYFRLNIFPIDVPTLRRRCEDIPLLVKAFVADYARRMNRRVETIPAETMEAPMRYEWPGNVRELQNFIERAVILSPGTSLRAPLESLSWSEELSGAGPMTLEQAQCHHIVKTLRETNWVLGGSKGAAERLGLKRTTLISKMRRLGLSCPNQILVS